MNSAPQVNCLRVFLLISDRTIRVQHAGGRYRLQSATKRDRSSGWRPVRHTFNSWTPQTQRLALSFHRVRVFGRYAVRHIDRAATPGRNPSRSLTRAPTGSSRGRGRNPIPTLGAASQLDATTHRCLTDRGSDRMRSPQNRCHQHGSGWVVQSSADVKVLDFLRCKQN